MMWSESFSEMFTYAGKAPELTPDKAEERKKTMKRMDEDLDRQIQRVKTGLKLDGTRYSDEELEEIKVLFGFD
ncbi:hypothetical protein LJC08_04210 [Methanimicrococcus sp. OttesenSCG-928-J09]|nr:hypothetical protein [Methanimicrococcus sp. OttesenSCG-928-J09]